MSLRLLLDEMVEHEVMDRLTDFGHDVEHVDLNDELDKGSPDTRVGAYSIRTERILVTYDSDYVEQLEESDFFCVLLFGDEDLSAKQVAQVVQNMSEVYPESRFRGLQKVGRNWIRSSVDPEPYPNRSTILAPST